jgi:midasin
MILICLIITIMINSIPRALYSHSIAGAGSISSLTGGGAVVTVATCDHALKKLMQLFRLSVAAATKPAPLERLELLGQFAIDVVISIRDFLSPEGYSCVAQTVMQARSISSKDFVSCSLFQQLVSLDIAGMCSSEYLNDLLSRCLAPVLLLLSNKEVRRSPLQHIPAVGAAWVHIGLLRLYLTLPQTPVDPATKSAVKARLLSSEVQLDKSQILATHLVAVLSAGPPVTLDMGTAAVLARQSEQQIGVLTARAVQRPVDAPSFDELFSELRGACVGLADIDRILALIARTQESFATLQYSCHLCLTNRSTIKDQIATIEGLKALAATSFDELSICAREEIGWQGSVAAFTERCCVYYTAYEDVTSPVLAAMQNLSTGMRMVVGWCFSQAEDQLLALTHGHSQLPNPVKRSQILIENSTGAELGSYTATNTLAKGWRGVMRYPHSLDINLMRSNGGDQVSTEAISQVHHSLQCSGLLSARAFKSISDLRAAQDQGQGNANKSIRNLLPSPAMVEKVCPQAALLLSLARLDYLVGGGSATCSSASGLFKQVLERFVHAYLKAEDDRKKRDAIKAALYQNKTQEKLFESDDVKEELQALRQHFPDHLSEFRDITDSDSSRGPDGQTVAQLRGDDDEDDIVEEEKVQEEEEVTLSVDPHTAALLIGYHSRMVYLHTMQQLTEMGIIWVTGSNRAVGGVRVGQREALDAALTSCCLMSAKGLDWGLRRLLAPTLEGEMRGGAMNALAFMAERCDSLSTSARVAAASSCWIARLTGLEAVIQPKKRRGKRGQKKGSLTPQQEAVSSIDRDLLLLLDPSAEGPWHPRDFNADAHPEEVMLAANPLRKLFDRATEVLQVYPGNELLVQVCQVAAKISALHTSTPVGKLLMTVQLLLVKAQEWEQYAAKHVSLQVEMAALSMLIGRWRELELKSWGDLLRCKEQSFIQVGWSLHL